MIYIVLIAAQFVFYAFPPDLAWAVGWNVQSMTIAALSAVIWHKGGNSSVAVLGLFSAITAICQWFGITLESHYAVAWAISALFAVWAVKQVALINVKPDKFTDKRYMYGISGVDRLWQRLNVLRPKTIGNYGGQIIIAGDKVFFAHRGIFKSLPLEKFDVSKHKLVDSGVLLNEETTKKLEYKVGKSFIPIIRDCSSLNVGPKLGYILLRRFFKRF